MQTGPRLGRRDAVLGEASLGHGGGEDDVAVGGPHSRVRVVELEGLGGGRLILDGPFGHRRARLVQALAQPAAARKNVHRRQRQALPGAPAAPAMLAPSLAMLPLEKLVIECKGASYSEQLCAVPDGHARIRSLD